MSTCLVTTLKDSINDENLLKLGEIKIHKEIYPDTRNMALRIGTTDKPVTVQIVGDGYFTDVNVTTNLGKTAVVPAKTNDKWLYVTSNAFDVIISDKYSLIELSNNSAGSKVMAEDLMGMSKVKKFINHFCGDIAYLQYIAPDATQIRLHGENDYFAEGDISVLSRFDDLSVARIYNPANFKSKIYGDISVFTGKNMTDISVLNTSVSGNLSALANNTALTYLSVTNSDVTGDTSSLVNLTKLTSFYYANTAITGKWPLT